MKLRIIFISLFVLLVSLAGTASADSSNNKETLAKALYAIVYGGGFGDNKYIFNKVEIIEVGKDLGRGAPIRFRLKGICGYKTQSEKPKDFSGFVWVGDTIEAEKTFNTTFVVFYSKNEFGRVVACAEGGFQCINEGDIARHRAMLKNMETQHRLAKAQDSQRQAEYARRQRAAEEERIERSRLEQLRLQAQVPTETLGTYICFNTLNGHWDNPEYRGEVTLTDVDVSYTHVYPHPGARIFSHISPKPDEVKVVIEFSNITKISKGGPSAIVFGLKHDIWIGAGHRIQSIDLLNAATRDRFYDDIIQAKSSWDQKHPELR